MNKAIHDANGDISSKRIWAFRFGWCFIILVSVHTISAVALIWFSKDIPEGVIEMLKYGVTASLVGNLTALGFTIPEWFAKGKGNGQ